MNFKYKLTKYYTYDHYPAGHYLRRPLLGSFTSMEQRVMVIHPSFLLLSFTPLLLQL